ncbi:thiamine-phosphate diphosphorylase [Cricetibacter osteomyelitidis]|uniref:Thiamine-phosphate synthase n=1 Tax=Cricetibacter osteomyelitidis TaxID=1521931 RepID=A0A4V2T226_9PAST|nr:thiamine phosphate synthase [Cricetibacter osteomyelitidis]TCP95793.1 thiamine-phosphate diphosphorylase [Cricetibacter osteomyelitidis]
MENYLRLYFIAGSQDCRHLNGNPADKLLQILQQALQAGITCFQFREKGKNALQNSEQILQLAKQCQMLCKQYNVPFFINDDIDLALKIQADGIHVGQDDRPIQDVIRLCQGRLQIGLSVNNLEQAIENAQIDGIDYFGVGPIFDTQSKADAKPTVGLNLLKSIRTSGIDKPLVAIGGITVETVSEILQAGADGVAVISAITQAEHIESAVKNLLIS